MVPAHLDLQESLGVNSLEEFDNDKRATFGIELGARF